MQFFYLLIVQFCANGFEILLTEKYIYSFFRKWYKSYGIQTKDWIINVFLVIVMTVGNVIGNNSGLNLLLSIGMIFFIMFRYTVNKPRKLFIGCSYIVISLSCELCAIFTVSLVTGKRITIINYDLYYISEIISSFLKLIFVILVLRLRKDDFLFNNINNITKIILLFPFNCFLVIFSVVMLFLNDGKNKYIFYEIIAYSILSICFLAFILFESMMKYGLSKIISDYELNLKDNYYKKLERSQNEIRRISHDLRHDLLIINEAINHGEIEEAQNVINNLYSDLQNVDTNKYTQNYMINAILNAKFGKADQYGIFIKYNIKAPTKINMNYKDIGILFGNLFDNAYEACLKCAREKRKIEIKILYYNQTLLISVSNSIKNKPNSFVTDKENKSEHGFGLKNVRRVVKKYNGDMKIVIEENNFICEVILFNM